MLVGDKLSKLISNLNPVAFIISCGRPWYRRHSEEEGIKAERERGERGVKSRMEGGIRGCFNNLGWFMPTNQMNKRRGI